MKRVLVLLFLLFLVGCDGVRQPAASGRDGSCKYTGNVAGHEYCATTFIQLLANPEKYDGRRVRLQGWAVASSRQVLLFPSAASAQGVETQASLVLSSGREISGIRTYVGSEEGGRRVQVGGVFVLNRQSLGGEGVLVGENFMRFGALDDVDSWSF